MKKLLLSVLAVLGVASVNAYEVNDFLYTPSAKFKVIGENLVTNGNFKDATTGWTNQEGTDVSALSWQFTEAAGPNGENAMMSLAVEEGNVLARVFELTPGNYAISYWIKGEATTALVNATGYANYAAFYVNTDASLTTNARQVNDRSYFNTEWREVTDTVSIAAGEYLVAYFDRMAVGTMVTNFAIHEVAQVYDTRPLVKELAFVKSLMEKTELFPEQGELPDVLGAIEAALAGDTSFGIDFSDPGSIAGIEDFMAQNYYPNKDAFLSANSAEMLQHISYGDIAGWPKFNNGDGKTGQGDWKFTGDRWGHGNGAVDGNKAISGSYNLGGGSVYIEKAGLRPGKYLFSLEVNAERYFKTKTQNDWYFPDYSYQLTGGKIFIGKDSIETGVFANRANEFDRHAIIAEVAEGDTLRAGFYFPGFGEDGGGRFGFKGAMLRLIGASDAEIALELLVKDIAASQNGLKVMIDSAKTVTAKTAEYPWGMNALIAAIPTFEDYLNSTYSIVDAEGKNVSLTVDLTDEQKGLPDSINTKMSGMRTAIQNLYALNKPIADIAEAIAYHRGEIVNELYAAAAASARAGYEASIAAAEALKASVTQMDSIPAADEKVKFEAAIADMIVKEVVFKKTCASYAAPAPETIAAPDFTGQTNKALPKNGWTGVNGADMRNQDWKYNKWNVEGREENGRGYVSGWRGATACPRAKVSQVVTLETEGVYELSAFVYGANEDNRYIGYFTVIADEETGTSIDTTFDNSKHRIFLGVNGIPDSTLVHSQYITDRYRPSKFSVYYVKEGEGPVEVELGFESRAEWVGKNGANMWGFGGVDLKYGGATAKYDADMTADLANYVGQANALIATEAAQAEVNKWMTIKLQRYVNDAAAATTLAQKMNTIHRLKETMARLNELVTGIEGVEAETVVDAEAKGIYSITGVKLGNELKGLQKGLYIINGKKYIVK